MKISKNEIAEYIMFALIFFAMIQSIFDGFSIKQYHWILAFSGMAVLLVSCILMDYFSWIVPCYIFLISGMIALKKSELLNGFQIIINKIVDAINQNMDLGFYYYISVDLEHSRIDSVIAIIFFFVCAGLLIGLMRRKPFPLFIVTCIFQIIIMIMAPYGVTSPFLLFLGAWIGYYNLKNNKVYFGIIIFSLFILAVIPLYFYEQISIPKETSAKRWSLLKIRKVMQGNDYEVNGGVGNGKIGGVGAISPSGVKLFEASSDDENTLYLKSFVSGDYQNGQWMKKKEDTSIFAGEPAIGLPFLFPELKINQLMPLKSQRELFTGDSNLSIKYQKINDHALLIPYYADLNQLNGEISGDRMMTKNVAESSYNVRYYSVKNWDILVKQEGMVQEELIFDLKDTVLEENYFRAMEEYQCYIEEKYLDVPQNIKEKLQNKYLNQISGNSKYEIIDNVRTFLKENYQYTYRPGLTPNGKDPVLFFLDEKKKGFCTQYASAAVFLLRSAGIPARYVEGYKIRKEQWINGKAQVTDYDAHAWAEVYVTNVGWIPIDVTGTFTGEKNYQSLQKKEEETKFIRRSKREIISNVKDIVTFILIAGCITVLLIITKMLQKKYQWKKLNNREKIIYYESRLNDKNAAKQSKMVNRLAYEIIQKAKFSQLDITDEEVRFMKRYVNVQKKK